MKNIYLKIATFTFPICLITVVILIFYLLNSKPTPKKEEQKKKKVDNLAVLRYSDNSYAIYMSYGFVGKQIEITANKIVVFHGKGNKEIEDHAQIKGPVYIGAFTSDSEKINLKVEVDDKIVFSDAILKKDDHNIRLTIHDGKFLLTKGKIQGYR